MTAPQGQPNNSDPDVLQPDFQLSAPDAQAFDALVNAGYELTHVPESLRPRAARVAGLLGLACQAAPASSPSLADRIMSSLTASPATEFALSKEDTSAFADFADAGYDLGQSLPKYRVRAEAHDRLMKLVTATPPGLVASADLAQRTFDLVMLTASAESRSFLIADQPVARGSALRTRFWDAVSVAAMLLLSASVLWPIMDAVKQRQQKTSCQTNLASVAGAFDQYAGSNRDSLPVATAGYGGSWWDVGTPGRSNSANLYTLARTGFAKVRDLACPGNLAACIEQPATGAMDWRNIGEVSYSYRIMFGQHQARWKSPERTVILADRSPVVLRALRGESVRPTENSPNHQQRGQDVLFADGSTTWITTPEIAASANAGPTSRPVDNIWLPWQIETIIGQVKNGEEITLKGLELPASEYDTFLGP